MTMGTHRLTHGRGGFSFSVTNIQLEKAKGFL